MVKIEKAGDFTGLAINYSKYRPNYSHSVLSAITGLLSKDITEIDFVDMGAGTGIWSRMVNDLGAKSVLAIEPNADMYHQGVTDSSSTKIKWKIGSAEQSHSETESADWISMASSLHWADFDKALKEFNRILRPNGIFTAIWNPRLIEINPLLVDIENHLKTLKSSINRVSSGRSGITKNLTGRLTESNYFEDVVYIDGRHTIKMDPNRYIGAWKSVNDLQVQLGEDLFSEFIKYVTKKVEKLEIIEAAYWTRSWSAKKKEIKPFKH